MKTLILVVMCLMLWGCGDISTKEAEQNIPLGYKILCSTEGNKYTVWFPKEQMRSAHVFTSKRSAMDYAVHWDKVRLDPIIYESDKYIWDECPNDILLTFAETDTPSSLPITIK